MVLVIGAIAPSPMAHAQTVPPLRQGLPYAQVRQALLEHGWQSGGQRERSPQDVNGFEAYLLNTLGYSEMRSCAGTGLGACRFEFTSGGRTLVVITTGESPLLERWWVE